MPIDQGSADLILQTARNFYKGSEKAPNKRYDLAELPNPTAKHIRRNNFQLTSSQRLLQYREWVRTTALNFLQIGRDLWLHRIRSANCLEMSSLAAYLASSLFPGHYQALFLGRLSPPGDHAFLLVSVDGTIPSGLSISGLAANTVDDRYWVIDPWTNTACRVADYPNRLITKFTQWSEQRKQVWFQGGWTTPRTGVYMTATLNSSLRWDSVHNWE
jgi:hypothetical protein